MVIRNNTVISVKRSSAVSFFMILFVFLGIAGVQAQQLTYPAELTEGTIIALQSGDKSPAAGKFIGVDVTNHLVPLGNVGQIPTDTKCHFKVLRYKNWIGLQSLSAAKNVQSVPGTFEVRAENTNFAQDSSTWEQFSFYGDMNAAWFKNNGTGGFLSVRTADGRLSTADHTGGPAQKSIWEQFKIYVIKQDQVSLNQIDRMEIDAVLKKVAEVEAALKIAQDEKVRLEKEKIALESAATQAQAALKLVQEDKVRLEKEKIASEDAATQVQTALKLAQEDKARLEIEKAAIQNVAIQAETEMMQAQQAASVVIEKAPVTSSVITTPAVTVPAVASAVTSVVSQVKPVAHVAQSETLKKQAVVSVAPTTVVPVAKKAATKKAPAGKKAAKGAKKPAGKKAAKVAAKANKGATKKKQSAQLVSGAVSPVETSVTSDVTQDAGVASPQDSTDTAKVQADENIKAPDASVATVVTVPMPTASVAQQKKEAQKPKKASKKKAKKKKNKVKKGVGTTTLQENQSLINEVSLEESEPIDELQPTDETAVAIGTVLPPPTPVVK